MGKVTEGIKILRDRGVRDFINEGFWFGYESLIRSIHKAKGKTEKGDLVYDYPWDVLIVLDACRVDMLKEQTHKYEFLQDINEFESAASYSMEWLDKNFTDTYLDEIEKTVHITGNPFTKEMKNKSKFLEMREVWKTSWDNEFGSIHPQPITEHAIESYRKNNPERMIVHYMQPHAPFIGKDWQEKPNPEIWGKDAIKSVWSQVRDGERSLEEAKEAYRNNLTYVLDSVKVLLENIDADDVVITADHGEMMGEYGIYGHPRGMAFEQLRKVPWVRTTARNTENKEVNIEDHENNTDRNQKLKQLGYITE